MAAKMISNMSKIVHDKVSYSGPYKPFKYRCDNDIDALAVNKDFSQVVVAGRLVFKVLNIKEDCFTDVVNLRSYKSRQDPAFSVSDVAWHPHDENVLASAATNGNVIVWNIGTRRKEMVFDDHKRCVNRVTFHGSEHNQLLSASQDGVVMIHDIRQQSVCMKFGSPGEIVKDAQFCPHNTNYFTFATAYGNSVQIWDMRFANKCERYFMAHNGPVYTLDWHPTNRNLLATAGRDKMIKVWDLSVTNDRTTPPPNLHSITNIAPVAHIKWRPQRKNHIASCSLQLDNSINVWDVNRPYIPFARFEGHDNTATCIKWREDCHTFLSCGKDGNVIQHVFENAKRPADEVNLAAVDFSINGRIGYVNSERNDSGFKTKTRQPRHLFAIVQSSLCVFQNYSTLDDERDPSNSLFLTEEEQFVHLAQQYQLEGSSFVDLCHHNGNIAESLKKHDVAQCWRTVATLLSLALTSKPGRITRTGSLSVPAAQKEFSDTKEHNIKSALKHPRDKRKTINGLRQFSDQTDGASGSNDDSSEVETENPDVDKGIPEMSTRPSVLFGEGGMDGNSMVWLNATGMLDHGHYNDDSISNIPTEGFCVRHELRNMTGLCPMVMEESDMANVPLKAHSHHQSASDHLEASELTLNVICDPIPATQPMDFTEIVANMIKHYAEMGDVQTVVTMLIVIGDLISLNPCLHESYQESWFLSYIDLLGQFELWKIANAVIKHSKLLGVCSMNQVSTSIHTLCAVCSRAMDRTAWLCDKCKRVTSLCSICHYPVKGRMAWCQDCGHGGHKEHIKAWFTTSSMCPAGCGHQCL